MRMPILLIFLYFSTSLAAQTYIIKSQGSNNGNGGAYVAPVVTKTFTLPEAKPQSNPYYSPSFSTNKNLPGNNPPIVKEKGSGSSELYTPSQSKADAARNYTCLSGDCQNGQGTFQGSPTSDYKYVGNFKNGKYHGKGKIYDWEGYVTYDGNFQEGRKEGYGRSVEYYQEKVFGDGSITRYNTAVRTIYEGMLKDRQRNGDGYLAEYTNKQLLISIYTGSFSEGKKDGEGVLLMFAKEKISAYYSGGWLNGEYHGIGIDSSEAGLFIGEFNNGMRHGEGTAYWSVYSTQKEIPVLKYTGQWKNGMKDGTGIEYDIKGIPIYEGSFNRGTRNGQGKLYTSDGKFTESTWVNGINQADAVNEELSATVAGTSNAKIFTENFKDNQRLWPHNSKYFFATVQKGVYHVECIGGEKEYNNFQIRVPGLTGFKKTDDWSFEVTAKTGNKFKVEGWYGIGWENAEFLINPNVDLFNFKYHISKSGYKGINLGDANVKKGYNTFLVTKKGDLIEARINGKKLYSGPAGDLSSFDLYLVMPKEDPDYKCYGDYKEVIFKILN